MARVIPASAALVVSPDNEQGALPFTPDWTPAAGSLITGLSPMVTNGNYSLELAGRTVSSLTSGGSLTIAGLPGNNTSTNYVTCGNGGGAGSLLVYTLPPVVNGYNLTNITVYGGWKDNGRDQQAYTVSYATVTSPSNFTMLATVNYNPSVPASTASATRVTIADSAGVAIVSNTVALKFDFTNPASENGYSGYSAIAVYGIAANAPTGPPQAMPPTESPANAASGISSGASVTLSAVANGSLPMSYQWQTDGGSGGAVTNIPSATNANLIINTSGYAFGTYRYAYVVTNSWGTNTSAEATIAIINMADIGISAPMPGSNDISQLLSTSQNDDGINYYTDNGAAYGFWCGQTFTTGSNPNGYLLKTLAWKSAGNGNSFGNTQLYDLYFYSISADGSEATVIASYQSYGSGTEGDWLQWRGLNVPLAPHQAYAYAFGHDSSSSGWELIANQGGNPYPSGQIMTVAHTSGTGPVTYGSTSGSDASFSLGLTTYQMSAPRALPPTLAASNWPKYAGDTGNITLNETALGAGPLTYQWLSDNARGGAMMPVNSASSSNLVVNLSGLTAGVYNYAVMVSNAAGVCLSPSYAVNVLGATTPSLVVDISPTPVQTDGVGGTAQYTAAFTGTPPIQYQWFHNNGSGPLPLDASANPSANSNVLILSDLQLNAGGTYCVMAQNYVGSVTSSVSTLVVIPPPNSPPSAVTVPPVSLQVSKSFGAAHLQWAQGILQQATNLTGPWIPLATNLEASMYTMPATNATMYFRSQITPQPRIVNLYCFCRDQDFRLANSQQVLFNATTQQVQLFHQANLPATFALQHDALIDTNYQNYFKSNLTTNDEIGAWWEITQSLVERAGLTWRGDHEWVSTANIDFSCGYTPAERIKLVDAYMADFHAIFGCYPKTVGSWYIDEVTLQYMQQQYGIVATANCKDQIGTDTYTLWGAYWNQAYYPSKVNAYMPAQTTNGQINLPVFRLLGSDPIYQYGNFTSGIYTLEPVYNYSGGSPLWVAWYFNALVRQPSLAFGYTQAGQENSFGWDAMSAGLTSQVKLIAAAAQAGEVQVMTLAQAGKWFRKNYSVTPPTSVVALDDSQQQGRKSVWYDSRYYRLNLLWDRGTFYIRDLHGFDENMVSATHSSVLTTTYFDYETLPVMDGDQWSGNSGYPAGMWPVLLPGGGFLAPQGLPAVNELNPTDLSIVQPLSNGGVFTITCTESAITCICTNVSGQSLNWAWNLFGGSQQSVVVQNISANGISYLFQGISYQLKLTAGFCQQLSNGNIQLTPDASGRLVLDLHLGN